ncbi:MAG: M23 family metallopeptidase [bacterium]
MDGRFSTFLRADRSQKALLLILFLTVPLPPVTYIAQAFESATIQYYDEASDVERLSLILSSLQEIRQALEQSATDTRTPLASLQAARQSGIPMGPPVPGTVSSHSGPRPNPFTGYPEFHKGIDIAAPRGTPVAAVADGIVLRSGWDGNHGKTVVLEHPGGFATRYGHLDEILVEPGDPVAREDLIGTVGDTGRATGPHLHYEILHDGQRIDPEPYIWHRAQQKHRGIMNPSPEPWPCIATPCSALGVYVLPRLRPLPRHTPYAMAGCYSRSEPCVPLSFPARVYGESPTLL